MSDTTHQAHTAHFDERAFHGLAGDYVRVVEPHSEADPAALLLTVLTMAGNAIGRGPHVQIEADRHTAQLYLLLVGDSARARKGVSRGRAEQLLRLADPDWADERIVEGMSTGEGLLERLRERMPDDDDEGDELPDPTVDDGRLLVVEPEYARVLRVIKRESNTLSAVLRSLWDRGTGGVLTRGRPIRVRGAHLSIVGHVTVEEFRREMDITDVYGGLLNRHLIVVVHRAAHRLPRGGSLADDELRNLGRQLERAVTVASARGQIGWTPSGLAAWEAAYLGPLDVERAGVLGAALARAEAQTLRLALLYALLDGVSAIDEVHVEAALAVWRYCERSAVVVFGDRTGDKVADRALDAIRGAGEQGLRRDDLRRHVFQRHVSADRLDQAISLLMTTEIVLDIREQTAGRPATRYVAAEFLPCALSALSAETNGDTTLTAHTARLNSPSGDATDPAVQEWAKRLLADHAEIGRGDDV